MLHGLLFPLHPIPRFCYARRSRVEGPPFCQCLPVKALPASPGQPIPTLCAWRVSRFVRDSLWHVFRSSISPRAQSHHPSRALSSVCKGVGAGPEHRPRAQGSSVTHKPMTDPSCGVISPALIPDTIQLLIPPQHAPNSWCMRTPSMHIPLARRGPMTLQSTVEGSHPLP